MDEEFLVEEKAILPMVGILRGDIDAGMFFDAATLKRLKAFYSKQSKEWFAQRQGMEVRLSLCPHA